MTSVLFCNKTCEIEENIQHLAIKLFTRLYLCAILYAHYEKLCKELVKNGGGAAEYDF